MIGLRFGFASLLAVGVGAVSVVLACGGSAFTSAPAYDGGTPATDAGPPPAFCATDGSVFDFCADFDEPLPGPWNNVAMPGIANVTEDDTPGTSPPSPPNSLLATAPELDVDGSAHPTAAAVVTKLGLPKGATHIAFDFRIDELSFPNGSDQTASVVALAYTQGTYAVFLGFRAVVAQAAPFDPWVIETVTPAVNATPLVVGLTSLHGLLSDVGTWTHVQIDFNIDNTIASADGGLAVQGTITVTGQAPKIVTLHPPASAALGDRTLSVGVESTAATGAAKLRFDNVTYSRTVP